MSACGFGGAGSAAPNGVDGWTATLDAGGSDKSRNGEPADAAVAERPSDVTAANAPAVASDVVFSYAIGRNRTVYRFDLTTKSFTPLPSAGCPTGGETAVFTDGSVYFTSSNNRGLFRLTATGCDEINYGGTFPIALGTAPKGTRSDTHEALVGYDGNDYVEVNTTTGLVSVVTAAALGDLRPSGDVVAIGTRGFLAAASGKGSGLLACPTNGDCIVEVDLKTGRPLGTLTHLPGLSIEGLARGHQQLIVYCADGILRSYDTATKLFPLTIATSPATASFTGAGSAPE